MSYIWLGVALFFCIVEAVTMGINFIWFSVGALAAMVSAMLGAQLWLQFVIFVVVTAAALYFTKPLVKKYIQNRTVPTNADRILGKSALVTVEIDNSLAQGEVRVDGQIWSAKSESGEIISVGQKVTVKKISGVKVVVSE